MGFQLGVHTGEHTGAYRHSRSFPIGGEVQAVSLEGYQGFRGSGGTLGTHTEQVGGAGEDQGLYCQGEKGC